MILHSHTINDAMQLEQTCNRAQTYKCRGLHLVNRMTVHNNMETLEVMGEPADCNSHVIVHRPEESSQKYSTQETC